MQGKTAQELLIVLKDARADRTLTYKLQERLTPSLD